MHHIVYTSRVTKTFETNGLGDLCDQSTRDNKSAGITGLLVFDRTRFMQVIEGDASSVRSLMARIATDDRHYNINYIADELIEQQAFPSWGLSCVGFRETSTSAGFLIDVKKKVQHMKNPSIIAAFIGFAKLAR